MTSQKDKMSEIDSVNNNFKKAHEPIDNGPKELKELSETQLLLLSTIIYNVDFTDYKGRTLGYVMNSLHIDDIINDTNGKTPQAMNKSEWEDIINTIKADKVLMALKINETENQNFDGSIPKDGNKSDGMRAAVFTHSDYKPTLVFRGTALGEWEDNAVGATEVLSTQNIRALDFFNSLSHENMVVTGHSKGGNNAMVIGALAATGTVSKVVSFDGQGVSNQFLEYDKTLFRYLNSNGSFKNYFGEIINPKRLNIDKSIGALVGHGKPIGNDDVVTDNRSRIINISADNDFVNGVFKSIAGDKRYIKTNRDHVKSFQEYHSPNAILYNEGSKDKVKLEIGRSMTKRGSTGELFHGLSNYIIDNPDKNTKKTLTELMQIIETTMKGENIDIEKYWKSPTIKNLMDQTGDYLYKDPAQSDSKKSLVAEAFTSFDGWFDNAAEKSIEKMFDIFEGEYYWGKPAELIKVTPGLFINPPTATLKYNDYKTFDREISFLTIPKFQESLNETQFLELRKNDAAKGYFKDYETRIMNLMNGNYTYDSGTHKVKLKNYEDIESLLKSPLSAKQREKLKNGLTEHYKTDYYKKLIQGWEISNNKIDIVKELVNLPVDFNTFSGSLSVNYYRNSEIAPVVRSNTTDYKPKMLGAVNNMYPLYGKIIDEDSKKININSKSPLENAIKSSKSENVQNPIKISFLPHYTNLINDDFNEIVFAESNKTHRLISDLTILFPKLNKNRTLLEKINESLQMPSNDFINPNKASLLEIFFADFNSSSVEVPSKIPEIYKPEIMDKSPLDKVIVDCGNVQDLITTISILSPQLTNYMNKTDLRKVFFTDLLATSVDTSTQTTEPPSELSMKSMKRKSLLEKSIKPIQSKIDFMNHSQAVLSGVLFPNFDSLVNSPNEILKKYKKATTDKSSIEKVINSKPNIDFQNLMTAAFILPTSLFDSAKFDNNNRIDETPIERINQPLDGISSSSSITEMIYESFAPKSTSTELSVDKMFKLLNVIIEQTGERKSVYNIDKVEMQKDGKIDLDSTDFKRAIINTVKENLLSGQLANASVARRI